MNQQSHYPPEVERLNVLTHLAGIVFCLASSYFILMKAKSAGLEQFFGVIVFLAGFLMMFLFSTLYHQVKDSEVKWLMKKADHISIYFMISGTYTPFLLIYMKNETGLTLLFVMWILTLAGTIFKIFTTGKFKILSTSIYVLMGIAILWISDQFFPLVPDPVVCLICTGGFLYLAGVLFYVNKSRKYNHPIWHLFVLGGAVTHWLAIWYSV